MFGFSLPLCELLSFHQLTYLHFNTKTCYVYELRWMEAQASRLDLKMSFKGGGEIWKGFYFLKKTCTLVKLYWGPAPDFGMFKCTKKHFHFKKPTEENKVLKEVDAMKVQLLVKCTCFNNPSTRCRSTRRRNLSPDVTTFWGTMERPRCSFHHHGARF